VARIEPDHRTQCKEMNSLSASTPVWETAAWIHRTQVLLDSFEHWLHRPLYDRRGTPAEQSRALYFAPQVVVAHGLEDDPILNYGNQAALELWEMDLSTLLQTPSRVTAEPAERATRQQMLERTHRHGFIDDYCGVRISRTGRRFLIRNAIVWNLLDHGRPAGQAATFTAGEFLS
jgi:hypothetical protein